MNLRLSVKIFKQFVGKFLVDLLQLQSTSSYDFSLREKKLRLKISFFYHLRQRSKNYRTSLSNIRRSCQNCILRVHKNILTKNCFLFGKDINLRGYRTFSGTFSEFYRNLSARFWKPDITCPFEDFEQEGFRGKSSVVFVFLGPWAKEYCPFVGNFLAGLLKLNSENRCHQFREKLFVYERSILLLAFSDIERLNFGPLSKNFRRDCDNCLQCLQKNIFTSNMFFEKSLYIIFFRPWAECFGVLSKDWRLSARLRKLLSTCPYECFFWKKNFFNKKVILYFSFWDHERKFFGLSSKNYRRSCENCFHCAHKNTSIFISEKYYSFWSILYIERFFWTLCWIFPNEVVKTTSCLFIGSFCREKYFDERTLLFFIQFETFSHNFWAVCWEIFVRFVAIAIYVFIRFLPTENFFVWKFHIFIISDNDRKKNRIPSVNLRKGCQNCILRVHKDILTKAAFFFEKI